MSPSRENFDSDSSDEKGSEMAVGCCGSLFGQRKENGTVGRRQETLKSLLGMTEMPR